MGKAREVYDLMVERLGGRGSAVARRLALALILYHAFTILTFAIVWIDGTLHALVDDDVMISLRYGRNLAQGLGLVYNEGERVEGFTNPLLTLVGAGLHLLSLPAPILPFGLHLMNLGLSLGLLWILTRFWGDRPADRAAGLFAAALYVLGPQHLFYAYAGYEVYMQAFLILYCTWRIEQVGWREALMLGLIPLTHGTSLVAWAVLGVAFVALYRGPWTRLLLLGTVALAPAAGYEWFRIVYYGEALPNTYWLKVGSGSLLGGLIYVRGWVAAVPPLLALSAYPLLLTARMAVSALAARMRAWPGRTHTGAPAPDAAGRSMAAAGVLAAHVLSVIALGGDFFPQSRFLFPCFVLLTPFAGRGVVLLLARLTALPVAPGRRALACGLTSLAVGALVQPLINYHRAQADLRDIRRWNIQHLTLGQAIRANSAPDEVVALFGLGYAGYYSERRCIDMLGKVDPHIARTKPHPGRILAHNKSDFGYVLDRAPDLVEMKLSPARLADIPSLTHASRHEPHGHTAELALQPAFRQRYAPHPVRDGRGRFLALYTRFPTARRPWRIAEEYFAEGVAPGPALLANAH